MQTPTIKTKKKKNTKKIDLVEWKKEITKQIKERI